MKEFEVTITETLEKKITVEAMSKDEAEQAVRDMWNDADIILDADDFIDVSFNTDDGQELSAVIAPLIKPCAYKEAYFVVFEWKNPLILLGRNCTVFK